MVIDQQGAHERIIYERLLEKIENHKSATQQELFPKTFELNAYDFEMVKELQPELESIGFDIRELGKNTFVIHGVPADTADYDSVQLLEGLLENYKQNLQELKTNKHENIARAMARNMAVKAGKVLSQDEMNNLVDELFACKMPYHTPSGNPTISIISIDELNERFNK